MSARPDLCGGDRVSGIPTAIASYLAQGFTHKFGKTQEATLLAATHFPPDAYLVRRNTTSLTNVAAGVVTFTLPNDAPAGTVVVISPAETIVNVAGTPLKVTPVVPDKSVP